MPAFCLNRAVATFGKALEAAIEEATHDAKNRGAAESSAAIVMNRWLGTPLKFANPEPTRR